LEFDKERVTLIYVYELGYLVGFRFKYKLVLGDYEIYLKYGITRNRW
jgi:hypothetical protein